MSGSHSCFPSSAVAAHPLEQAGARTVRCRWATLQLQAYDTEWQPQLSKSFSKASMSRPLLPSSSLYAPNQLTVQGNSVPLQSLTAYMSRSGRNMASSSSPLVALTIHAQNAPKAYEQSWSKALAICSHAEDCAVPRPEDSVCTGMGPIFVGLR